MVSAQSLLATKEAYGHPARPQEMKKHDLKRWSEE